MTIKILDRSLVVSECLGSHFEQLKVYLALYEEVTNADAIFNYVKVPVTPGEAAPTHVFLNPHMSRGELLLSSFNANQFAAWLTQKGLRELAVLRALQNEKLMEMKSKSVATEILFSLSSSPHISECLKHFGVHSSSTEVLFVAVLPENGNQWEKFSELTQLVDGRQTDPRRYIGIPPYLHEKELGKHMKITSEELELSGGLNAAIISRVAIKNI